MNIKKVKLKKKTLVLFSILIGTILLFFLVKLILFPQKNIEDIKNIDNITVSANGNIIITFLNDYRLIDSCIVTTNETYKELKNKSKEYQMSLKEYLKLSDISNKEIYNINKAIELELVNEDTKYSKYLAITCGFKNEKELIENIGIIKKSN